MKKVFATLAAAAMAFTMCAFTGCGNNENNNNNNNNNTDVTNPGEQNNNNNNNNNQNQEEQKEDGVIKGDYKELTAEQLLALFTGENKKVDPEKFFGETVGLGVKAGLEATADNGAEGVATGSLALDYKMSFALDAEKNPVVGGYGTAKVKYDYDDPVNDEYDESYDLLGTLYHDAEVVYASLEGLKNEAGEDEDMKIKLNLPELFEGLMGLLPGRSGGEKGPDTGDLTPALYATAAEDETGDTDSDSEGGGFTLESVLGMAYALGVKVYADTTDGVKLKVSVTEDTLWSIVAFVMEEDPAEPSAEFTYVQEAITVNKFQFDLYFALDKDGAFAGAGLVAEVDVEAKGELFDELFEAKDSEDLAVKAKAFVEVYTHKDTVTVPDEVKNDDAYFEGTEFILGMLEELLGGDSESGNDNSQVVGPTEQQPTE